MVQASAAEATQAGAHSDLLGCFSPCLLWNQVTSSHTCTADTIAEPGRHQRKRGLCQLWFAAPLPTSARR